MKNEDISKESFWEPSLLASMRKAALQIWNNPEIGTKEHYALRCYGDLLEKEGFSVVSGVGDLDTALIASWGKGGPVIGFLGEYDALPGLSQEVKACRSPLREGEAGHGCGHNLLGAASFGAAVRVKRFLEKEGLPGRVRFYGCPAEENNGGKVFMAREGVFEDLSAALTWHPWYANALFGSRSLALNAFYCNFHGRTAHAAASPEEGRSALDAAILMDVGVNYLREHIVSEARVHSVITRGGETPNVVPGEASICYYVRAPRRKQVEEIYRRVLQCARGAALMTDTTMEIDFIDGLYDYLPNRVLGGRMMEHFRYRGAPEFDEKDLLFARELQQTLHEGALEKTLQEHELSREELTDPLCRKVLDRAGVFSEGRLLSGSTDVGDVSHLVPTAQITTCCMPLGVPLHSWQSTASFGSSIGLRGMETAAFVLGDTGMELFRNPSILEAAREEFVNNPDRGIYKSPLPEDARPVAR